MKFRSFKNQEKQDIKLRLNKKPLSNTRYHSMFMPCLPTGYILVTGQGLYSPFSETDLTTKNKVNQYTGFITKNCTT